MTNLLSIIFSLIVLLLIIFIKDMASRHSKNVHHRTLYYKLTNFNRLLIVISIIIFIIVTTIDYNINNYERSWLSFITIVLNGLAISILALPLSVSNIYNTTFEDEERLLDTKYIVTKIYDKKMIQKFNRAGIKVIIISKEKIDSKIKVVSEKNLKKQTINSNLIIQTDNEKVVKKIPNALYEFDDLKKCYKVLEAARSKADNISRIMKYNTLTYVPLILLYFVLVIAGYPVIYSILITLLIKLLTIMTTEYVYKKMPHDSDLMNRMPIENGKIVGYQEKLFVFFTCIASVFCYTLPYQYIVYSGGTINLAITILLTTLIFNNIFTTYHLYSESSIANNIIKSFKNINILVYVIALIVVSILINYVTFLGTKNIGLQNYIVCVVLGLIPLLILEIVKFARFMTPKGKKKHAIKNNKRNKKS